MRMEPIVAKCGYRCDLCLSFEPNFRGDETRRRLHEAFKKYYGYDVPLEDIKPCKGCRDAQQAPDKECPVFPCAQERGLENCGHCDDFGCDKLAQRMDVVEAIRARHPAIPEEDHSLFFLPYLSRPILEKIRKSSDK